MAKFRCAACKSWQGFVNTTSSKDADIAAWKERNGHLCETCTAGQRARAAEDAAKAAQAAGLPALQGSPAQTAWAEQLRANLRREWPGNAHHANARMPGCGGDRRDRVGRGVHGIRRPLSRAPRCAA